MKHKEVKRREDKEILYKLQDGNTTNTDVERLKGCLKQSPCTGRETIKEEWDLCKNTIQQLYGEVNSVKNTTLNIWLNGGVY